MDEIEKLKTELKVAALLFIRTLEPIEEMASLTERPDDAQLAKEIREWLEEK